MCRFIEKLKRNTKKEIIFERKRGEKQRERSMLFNQSRRRQTHFGEQIQTEN
jgi:hypothetical protein